MKAHPSASLSSPLPGYTSVTNRLRYLRVLILALLIISGMWSRGRASTLSDIAVDDYNYRMSTINIGGTYPLIAPTGRPLLDGANEVLAFGSRNYKFVLQSTSNSYGLIISSTITSLKLMAQCEPQYRALFDLPNMKNYVFWCYTFANPNNWNWTNGFTTAEQTAEYNEIYELAQYLLTQYNNTGKNFYLGNWEGDWSVGVTGTSNPSPTAIQGMIDWANTRQRAVDDAMANTPHTNVNVYYYIEVNRVVDAVVNPPSCNQRVINCVVPYVPNLDFVSWSSYDIQSRTPSEILTYLNYAESKIPTAKSSVISGKRLFIGEFGWGNKTEAEQVPMIQAYDQLLFDWGAPFSFYWELSDNGTNSDGSRRYFDLVDRFGYATPIYSLYNSFLNDAKLLVLEFKQNNGRLPSATEYAALVHPLLDTAIPEPTALTVDNLPAASIGSQSATLGGELTQGLYGDDCAHVYLYMGTADGGTVAGAWQNVIDLGLNTHAGTVSYTTSLTNLAQNAGYYYRLFASNAGHSEWAPSSGWFTTAPVYTFLPTLSGTYAWSSTGGWDGHGIPVSGTGSTLAFFPDITTPIGSGSFTISGSSMTLNVLNLNGLGASGTGGASTLTIGNAGSAWTFAGAAPSIHLNAMDGVNLLDYIIAEDLVLSQDLTISGDGTAGFTFSGAVSGAKALVKAGSSTLTLSGSNTFSGGLFLNEGILACTSSNAFGNGTIYLGATSGSASATLCGFNGTVTTNNPIVIRAGGTGLVTIQNASTSTGSAYFGGNLTVNRDVNLNGGAGSNYYTYFKTGTLSGNGTITAASSGSNATVILQHPNSSGFTGNVVAASGILRLQNSSALNATNPVQVNPGARLDVQNSVTIAGLNDLGGNGGTVSNNSGGAKTLTLGGSGNYSFNGMISGTTSTNQVRITKAGSGTQVLSGINNNAGYYQVSSGKLQFAKSASLYNGNALLWTATNIRVNAGGTLAFNVGGTGEFTTTDISTLLANLAVSTGTASGVNAGAVYGFDTTNAGGNFTISDAVANTTGAAGGAIGLAKFGTGTLILAGNCTYSGTTTVAEGNLQIGAGSVNGTVGSGDILLASGANVILNRSNLLTLPNSITGAGGLVQAGAGTSLLSATNTYTGSTQILAGSLILGATGSIANTNSFSIGAGASLDTTAKSSFAMSAPVSITLDPANGGSCGQIQASNLDISSGVVSFNLAGVLDDPAYVLATYTSKTGNAFASVTPPTGYYLNYAYAGGTQIALVAFSKNADLAGLSLSNGTLDPAFSSSVIGYTASVPNGVSSLTVTPTVADTTASLTVNGISCASGVPSQGIPLSVGYNTITTVVTAEDGVTTKTYTVSVFRALSSNCNLAGLELSTGTLSPDFYKTITSYTATVPNATASITVTPTIADLAASVKVNGTSVITGHASPSIDLAVGTNTISTVVTAQDGSVKTYTVVVTRLSNNANLGNLALSSGTLAPAFAPSTTNYTTGVLFATASVTITPTVEDTTASVQVNGTTVASGSASNPISLSVGPNTISVVVTAEDGTVQTYTVVVTRAPFTFLPTTAGTYAWTSSSNWDVNGVPVSSTSAVVTLFQNTTTALGNGTYTINSEPNGLVLNGITINGCGPQATGAANVTLGTAGNTWTLDGAAPTINLNGMNGVKALNVTVAENLALNQNTTFTGNGTAGFTFSGALSGNGALTKTGASTLVLSANNPFNGGLYVLSGTVQQTGTSSSLGTGTVYLGDTAGAANATLKLMSGGGSLTPSIQVRAGSTGTLILAGPGAGGSANLNNALTLNNTVTIDAGNTSGSFINVNGSLAGSGNLILADSGTSSVLGTLQLLGNGTGYTGSVVLTNGFLRISATNALNATNVVQVNAGATLDVKSNVTIAGLNDNNGFGGTVYNNQITGTRVLTLGGSGTYSFSGVITNGGTSSKITALTMAGSGVQSLGGVNTYTGATQITSGTLALLANGSFANSSSLTIAAGAKLDTSAKSSFAAASAQPITFGVDGTGSGSTGRIQAGNLNITNAVVNFNVTGTLDDPVYILATYTSLTGSAFASVTPPAGYSVVYNYASGTQIALVKN